MNTLPLIVTAGGFPQGLRCVDCDALMPDGAEYRERLLTLGTLGAEDCAVVEIICVECDEEETSHG